MANKFFPKSKIEEILNRITNIQSVLHYSINKIIGHHEKVFSKTSYYNLKDVVKREDVQGKYFNNEVIKKLENKLEQFELEIQNQSKINSANEAKRASPSIKIESSDDNFTVLNDLLDKEKCKKFLSFLQKAISTIADEPIAYDNLVANNSLNEEYIKNFNLDLDEWLVEFSFFDEIKVLIRAFADKHFISYENRSTENLKEIRKSIMDTMNKIIKKQGQMG